MRQLSLFLTPNFIFFAFLLRLFPESLVELLGNFSGSALGYCRGYGTVSGVGGTKDPCRPHAVRKNIVIKKGICRMSCFHLATIRNNYTKYLCAAIAAMSLFATDVRCGTFMHWIDNVTGRNLKIKMPFTEEYGYLNGGQDFDGTIYDESNKKYTIKDFEGNVVIIIFSTTWCPNCPAVLKMFNDLKGKLAALGIDNVKIVHLNVGKDPISAVKKQHEEYNMNALDTYHSIPGTYMKEINAIPACLVFDKKGKSVWGYVGGGVDYLSDEFVSFIVSLSRQKI